MTGFSFALMCAALAASACVTGKPLPESSIDSTGARLFNGYVDPDVSCYKCHGGAAEGGGAGPDLSKRVPKMTEDQIVEAIDEGPGFMPSYREKLTPAQSREIAAWLRSRFARGE